MEHEHPRAVFLAACGQIAESLKPEGYRFTKNRPKAWRANGDWRFEVLFQSDWHNVAGQYVGLVVHAFVRNKSVLAWERHVGWPLEGSDFVAGAQMGHVQCPYRWLNFNLADTDTRDTVIADIAARVRTIILPFFARFDQPQSLAREVLRTPNLLPSYVGDPTLQALRFVFWQLGGDAAEDFLGSSLSRLSQPEALKRFRVGRDHPNRANSPQDVELPDPAFPAWLIDQLSQVARSTGIGSAL